MRFLWLIFLTVNCSQVMAQSLNYKFPALPTQGKNISAFTPRYWTVRDSTCCDFNKDGLEDMAIVLQTKQPVPLSDTTGFSTQPFYPKILAIALQQPCGSFQLSCSETKLFGTCNWGVQGQDPFQKLSQRRNTLGITFMTGGTMRNTLTYYFKFQDTDWMLIGAESYQYWAGHTDDKEAFYNEVLNLVTGVREASFEDGNHKRTSYKKTIFKKQPLIRLSEFSQDSNIPFLDE